MPVLAVLHIAAGCTEYRVTSSPNRVPLFASAAIGILAAVGLRLGSCRGYRAAANYTACANNECCLQPKHRLSMQVLWHNQWSFWAQAASVCLAAAFACSWLFDTDHESILHFDGLAVQLQSRLRCGTISYKCLLLEKLQDIVICEHVTTTEVHFYLAFKLKDKQDMVVAYKALLPRLHLIQPVYRKLLHDLQPHL